MSDPDPSSPYTLLVARRSQTGYCRVWPAHLQRPLPATPDIMLELQPLVEAIYARRHYDPGIDYRKPLQPPLSAEQAAWLHTQLPARSAPP